MIARHQKHATHSTMCFAISLCVAGASAGLAWVVQPSSFLIGIFLAVVFIGSAIATAVYYVDGILAFSRAKGYNASFFSSVAIGLLLAVPIKVLAGPIWAAAVFVGLGPLLPLIIVAFLPDESNPALDEQELRLPGVKCVQCDGRIPATVKLCPHCGWTQPACDVAAPANPAAPTAAASTAAR